MTSATIQTDKGDIELMLFDTDAPKAAKNFVDLQGRLPKNYTIFGQVTKGMDVVDAIAAEPLGPNDRPRSPVAMKSVAVRDS